MTRQRKEEEGNRGGFRVARTLCWELFKLVVLSV